jgi:hypothetical protein
MISADEIKKRQQAAGTYVEPPARQFRGCTLKERLELKEWAISLKGGCCRLCGYSNRTALEFHHLSPHEKEFSISTAINRVRFDSIERVKVLLTTELVKCVLLCANCHREVEAGFVEAPSGS